MDPIRGEERKIRSALEILKSTHLEAAQIVDNPEATYECRLAWYFTHIGEIEMAWFIGLINDVEMRELEDEWKKHHPGKPSQTPQRTWNA